MLTIDMKKEYNNQQFTSDSHSDPLKFHLSLKITKLRETVHSHDWPYGGRGGDIYKYQKLISGYN